MQIEQLYRYPVKGLTAEALDEAETVTGGAITWDRAFALAQGDAPFDPAAPTWLKKTNFMCLMKNARIAALRSAFDPAHGTLTVTAPDGATAAERVLTQEGRTRMADFLTGYLAEEARGTPRFHHVPGHVFGDQRKPVVSLINLASLAAFEATVGAPRDRMRFRANVYFTGPAWSEFEWVGREVMLGGVRLRVTTRTIRCQATEVNPRHRRARRQADAGAARGLRPHGSGRPRRGDRGRAVRHGRRGAAAMIPLSAAAVVWVGVHAGIAGTAARRALVGRIGEVGFLSVFSLASVAAIAWLVGTWKDAPVTALWSVSSAVQWLLVLAMLPAFILFISSVAVRSPTMVGGTVTDDGPRGLLRVTRHPMLWSFTLWSAVHVIANGDMASLIFFGAFGVTSLVGMPSIDAKVAARDPAGWRRFAAVTSIVPFAAIAAGRNHLVLREIRWVVLAGAVAWAAMLYAHPWIIGVPAVPG